MASSLVRRLPFWAIAAFALGITLAMSPNIVNVYGIHNDYEALTFKNHGLLFTEAPHLFAIARPISALLANLTLLPAETIADFRWTRIFSTLTVWLLGFQLMSICVHHLRTSTLHALVIALSTFLVPAFIYSVLNAPAWGAHLVPVFFALAAYAVLSRANVQALALGASFVERDARALWLQTLRYCALRPVWGACVLLQLALYDFPPNALIVTIFPVILVLLSCATRGYRYLIAARDLAFIGINVLLFALSTKLLYLPFVESLTFPSFSHSTLNSFQVRVAATYDFKINTDPVQILSRLKEIARVAADLWWLPQMRLHLAFVFIVMLAVVLEVALARRTVPMRGNQAAQARKLSISAGVSIACFLMASATVLFAGGGFISYRTIAVPTAIAGVVVLWAADDTFRKLGQLLAPAAVGVAAASVVAAVALAAVAGNFQLNELTMRLARNESTYFRQIVRDAIANRSTAVVIVDPRPFSLPEDHRIIYDENGRPIPPYELACFSSYCLQNGAIVTILARELGADKLKVYTNRGGDPFPGLTCAMIVDDETPTAPSEQLLQHLKFLRSLKPITCVSYSLAWHSLSYRSSQ